MKRISWIGLFVLIGTFLATAARGQDVQLASTSTSSYDSRISDLEARIAAMQGNCGGGGCQEASAVDCCRKGGWIAGAEMTFLRPHASQGTRGADDTPLLFDFEAAPRMWVGYVGDNGLGFRFRYWDFDHTKTVDSRLPTRLDSQRFNLSTLDLEMTMVQDIGCNWELTLSGGARYVDYAETQFSGPAATGVIDGSHAVTSATWGPTVSAEVRRPILGCWSVFGNVRGSALYGDQKEWFNGILANDMRGNVKYISETQLGLDFRKPLKSGSGSWFARAAVEGQYWSTFSGEPGFDGSGSIGLVGMALSAGIAR